MIRVRVRVRVRVSKRLRLMAGLLGSPERRSYDACHSASERPLLGETALARVRVRVRVRGLGG